MANYTFSDFSGGLNNFQDKRLISLSQGQEFIDIDTNKNGAMIPIQDNSDLSITPTNKFAYRWRTYDIATSDYRKYVQFDGELYYLKSNELYKRNSSGTEKIATLKGLYSSSHSTTNSYTGTDYGTPLMSMAVTQYDSATGNESGAALYEGTITAPYHGLLFNPVFNTTFNSGETLRFYFKITGTWTDKIIADGVWYRAKTTITLDAGKTLDKLEVWDGYTVAVHYTDSTTDSNLVDNSYVVDTPPLADMDAPTDIIDFDVYNSSIFICRTDSNKLYFSDVFQPSAWSELNTINLPYDIVAVNTSAAGLIIHTQYTTHILIGSSSADYSLLDIAGDIGCLHKNTVAVHKNLVVFLSNEGLMALDNTTLIPLTKNTNTLLFPTTNRLISSIIWDFNYLLINSPNTAVTNANYRYRYNLVNNTMIEIDSNQASGDPHYSAYKYDNTLRLITPTKTMEYEGASGTQTFTYKSPFYMFDTSDKKKFNYVDFLTSGSVSYTIEVDGNSVKTGALSGTGVITKVQISVVTNAIGTGIEITLTGTGTVFNYTVDYDVLETTKNKELFEYLEIEHTSAITYEVYDSNGTLKGSSKSLLANKSGVTRVALGTTFFDYYGYLNVTAGTVLRYNLVPRKLSAKPRLFIGAIIKYVGIFNIDFNDATGSATSQSIGLSSSISKTEKVVFTSPISDIDILWDISSYSESADMIYNIEFITVDIEITPDKPKQLFEFIELEHSTAVTFEIKNSASTVIETRTVPISEAGKSLIAINNPFVDYYSFINITSGTCTNYKISPVPISTSLQKFVNLIIEYTGAVTMQLVKPDGTDVFSSAISKDASTNKAKSIINLPAELIEPYLKPEFTGTIYKYTFTVEDPTV